MSHRRSGVLLAVFTIAACILVGGCQSTSSLGSILTGRTTHGSDKQLAAAGVLAPGMVVEWHIKTTQKAPEAGRGTIAADGTLDLGPYGVCRIGGMPAAKATAALEKHLARYLRAPAVQIRTPTPLVASGGELTWRKSGSATNGGVRTVAFQSATPLGDKDKTETETIGPPRATASPALAMPHDIVAGAPPVPPVVGLAPNECRQALLPPYVIGPTDVLRIESAMGLANAPIGGPHLVGPDGTVRVGVYGAVVVAGQTLDQARVTVSELIHSKLRQAKPDDVRKDEQLKIDPKAVTLDDVIRYTSVDVLAYNSKQFFIIADGGGLGEQVVPLPVTGNDTVLNAMAKIGGLPLVSSKHHIWVARSTCPGCPETILPVDWIAITRRGEGITNYQLMANDRIYVQADVVRTFNNQLAKFLAPVNQLFGAALLSSQTINSIKSGSVTGAR
jgi:protein involved in polysaccharide export with SLBB domain